MSSEQKQNIDVVWFRSITVIVYACVCASFLQFYAIIDTHCLFCNLYTDYDGKNILLYTPTHIYLLWNTWNIESAYKM